MKSQKQEILERTFTNGILTHEEVTRKVIYSKKDGTEEVFFVTGRRRITREAGRSVLVLQVIKHTCPRTLPWDCTKDSAPCEGCKYLKSKG